jgi:hypothetical protein
MNIRRLIERSVRNSTSEFANVLAARLEAALAGRGESDAGLVSTTSTDARHGGRRAIPRAKTDASRTGVAQAGRPKTPRSRRTPHVVAGTADVAPATAEVMGVAESAAVPGVASVSALDFEVDLPILRATARGTPVLVVGVAADDATIVELRRATGLLVEGIPVSGNALESVVQRIVDQLTVALVIVDGTTDAAAMESVISHAARSGLLLARAVDASLLSLLTAFDELEQRAAGSPSLIPGARDDEE